MTAFVIRKGNGNASKRIWVRAIAAGETRVVYDAVTPHSTESDRQPTKNWFPGEHSLTLARLRMTRNRYQWPTDVEFDITAAFYKPYEGCPPVPNEALQIATVFIRCRREPS
jgi:hypothetical protein